MHVRSRVNCTARAEVHLTRVINGRVLTEVSGDPNAPTYAWVGGRPKPRATVVVPPCGVVRNVMVIEETEQNEMSGMGYRPPGIRTVERAELSDAFERSLADRASSILEQD